MKSFLNRSIVAAALDTDSENAFIAAVVAFRLASRTIHRGESPSPLAALTRR